MSGIEPTQRDYIRRIVDERLQNITPQLGIVETAYPHSEESDDSNYEVDVRLLASGEPPTGQEEPDSGSDEGSEEGADEDSEGEGEAEIDRTSGSQTRVQTHHRVPVGVEMPGASRGLQQGDMVLVQYLQADSDRPIVTHAFYDATPANRAPLTEEGDWRRRIGDEAVVEVVTTDDGSRQINIGRQSEDRGDLTMGLSLNLGDGSFSIFDAEDKGLSYDGEGNATLDWESMAMPWGAAGPVNWVGTPGSGVRGSRTVGGWGGDFDSPSGWVNPAYLMSGEPPSRSTTEYTSNYGGLQDALDSIGEDTRLVIDDGPYTGQFDLAHTNHVTIDGDGTTLERSDIDSTLFEINTSGNEYSTTTGPGGVGTYSAGQSSIEVQDASIFSAGDIIRLYSNEDHPDQPHTGSGGDGEQGLFHVVADVNGDTLTLEEDLLLDWNNPNGGLRIDNVDWSVEDVRITNITFEGNDQGRNGRPGRLTMWRRCKELWLDNCTFQNARGGVWTGESFQIRMENCVLNELGVTAGDGTRGYPLDATDGTHHIYVTNCESYASQRYGFKSGSGAGMWPTRNGRFENCHAEPDHQRGFDQHQGSHHWEYINCTSVGQGFGRDRSDGYFARGGGVDSPGSLTFYARDAHEARTVLEEQHYVNVGGTNHVYQYLDDGGLGPTKTLTLRDVWAETNESLNSFFKFVSDGGGTVNIQLENVAINGTWITDSNWGGEHQTSGSNPPTVNATITTSHGGREPAEYFDDQYNWTSGQL